jgi:hypothetical protein
MERKWLIHSHNEKVKVSKVVLCLANLALRHEGVGGMDI